MDIIENINILISEHLQDMQNVRGEVRSVSHLVRCGSRGQEDRHLGSRQKFLDYAGWGRNRTHTKFREQNLVSWSLSSRIRKISETYLLKTKKKVQKSIQLTWVTEMSVREGEIIFVSL